MVKQDYYDILDIDRYATNEEIKSAYRKKAKKYHPDLNPNNPDAEEQFKKVNEAWGVLKDTHNKVNYDTTQYTYNNNNSYKERTKHEEEFRIYRSRYNEYTNKKYNKPYSRLVEYVIKIAAIITIIISTLALLNGNLIGAIVLITIYVMNI